MTCTQKLIALGWNNFFDMSVPGHSNCSLREALSVLFQVNWAPRVINIRDKNAVLKCGASLSFKKFEP